ncbi:MAG: hypothetical protein HUK20_01845, partial [Fibrobacter sp.]|nr:hypothetical protein [Fibrobacter sp.]
TVKVNKQTAGFWIFKKTKTKSNKDTAIKKICTQEGTEIRIGMNVAKVAIEREWFNPGVFNLTSDMVNYSENNLQISQGSFEDEQNKNDSIFPCYPVAMLIARDVSINIKTSSSTNSTDIRTAEEETANSSSFLVFHKNNGNSSSSSKSKCSTSFSEDGLNIRIADPQVIGFYLQATPKDNSQPAGATSMSSMEGFIDSYKEMLLEIQKDFTK